MESSTIAAAPTASESPTQPDAATPSQLVNPKPPVDAIPSRPDPEDGTKASTGPPTALTVGSSSMELSKDERALRALLQFCVCTEGRKKSLLNMRYRELILSCYANIQEETTSASSGAVSSSTPAASSGAEVDSTKADAPAVAVSAASEQTNAPASGGSAEVAQPPGAEATPAGSSLEDKERLKQQLKAKQEALAQQVQRLRQKAAAGGSIPTAGHNAGVVQDLESPPPPAGHKAGAVQDLESAAPPADASTGPFTDSLSGHTLLAPDPSVSQEEREAALKRKWEECVDAAVEVERLEARKAALEELAGRLRAERAAKQQERVQALRLVQQRREEEARLLEKIKTAVATSGGLSLASAALPSDLALAGQQITSLE